MRPQHAERERAPFEDDDDDEIIVALPSGQPYVFHLVDLDRDKLVLSALRNLKTLQDNERERAAKSKASRETASRYGEVFTGFDGLGVNGATVRDRNRRLTRLLANMTDAEREADIAVLQRGRPWRHEEFIARVLHKALRPQDFDANGMLTKEGGNRVASAVFHAERWYRAERVGLGAIPVRSVTDTWFLLWLNLRFAELGAILTAVSGLPPGPCSDDDLRRELARVRRPRSYARGERPHEVEARLAKVAWARWRKLQALGAANARDLSRFDNPMR